MKSFIFLVLMGSSSLFAFSQPENLNLKYARNAFYLEGGGMGILGSLNFERRYFTTEKLRFGFRMGVGLFPDESIASSQSTNGLIVPLSGLAMWGPGPHQLEGGLGTSLLLGEIFNSNMGNTLSPTIQGKIRMIATGQLGYRYHSQKKGIVIRATYTPLFFYLNATISGEKEFDHWFGLSVGYALPNAVGK